MENQKSFLLFILQSFFVFIPFLCAADDAIYNVQNFGADSGGVNDSSKAFVSAWAVACASNTSATIYVPPGKYLLGYTLFAGNKCRNSGITMQINGTLVAPANYSVLGSSGNWIKFQRVNGLSVYGGTLDGQGTGLWACKNNGSKNCPTGATNLAFYNSNKVFVSGLSSLNSQRVHILLDGCNNTRLEGVEISAAESSPNTDGIHVMLSSGISIMNSQIATGDDCISIGPGSTNLWVENITCGPGHGISIGSLGSDLQEPGVQNVVVKTVTFTNTENGFRVKTLARASNGFVKGVLFLNATMFNVKNPIIINQYYCPNGKGCSNKTSGVKISDVTFQDVHGTSTTQAGVKINCSKQNPCTQITLDDINLSYNNKTATAACSDAGGTSYGAIKTTGCLS